MVVCLHPYFLLFSFHRALELGSFSKGRQNEFLPPVPAGFRDNFAGSQLPQSLYHPTILISRTGVTARGTTIL
jgi:hypothetical protein